MMTTPSGGIQTRPVLVTVMREGTLSSRNPGPTRWTASPGDLAPPLNDSLSRSPHYVDVRARWIG